ncbi:MAG TPA: TetR/AcrR family transcriptional regulator [Verrucomicrobiae bacterium]|nr:TetR/AcrR family transcriptional regulator [Verrucomicrobiae bacterium]
MAASRALKKRGYLAKDARHEALLKTAAAVVEKHGWPALSMISVAEHAKVSRQLVYEHFSSVDQLMTETMSQIFRELYERMRETIRGNPRNLADLTRFAERLTFDLSPGRTRALWQMITATYSGSAESTRMSRRLRHLLTNLWTPTTRDAFGLPDRDSRALTWMLHMAFWGAHQLVDEGEMDRAGASKLFLWMVTQIQAGAVVAPVKGGKK